MAKVYYKQPRRPGPKPGRKPTWEDAEVLNLLPATSRTILDATGRSPSGLYYRLRLLETEGKVRRARRTRDGWLWEAKG